MTTTYPSAAHRSSIVAYASGLPGEPWLKRITGNRPFAARRHRPPRPCPGARRPAHRPRGSRSRWAARRVADAATGVWPLGSAGVARLRSTRSSTRNPTAYRASVTRDCPAFAPVGSTATATTGATTDATRTASRRATAADATGATPSFDLVETAQQCRRTDDVGAERADPVREVAVGRDHGEAARVGVGPHELDDAVVGGVASTTSRRTRPRRRRARPRAGRRAVARRARG